ncbi:hypothetical protein [Acinetobacter baumannii]|uniref:hypothetical protein n=1 Tax=Acinetobacter baumannii TaxID=470 RepID=UPI0009A9DC9A|nr:hypothetical protein [Acinetobacter baumannii]
MCRMYSFRNRNQWSGTYELMPVADRVAQKQYHEQLQTSYWLTDNSHTAMVVPHYQIIEAAVTRSTAI